MPPTRDRTVLFLQGPPSRFWTDFADALEARGARIRKIGFNLGDQLFWRRRGAVSYRGPLADWPRWVRAFIRREGVTDVVYFNDRPPYHRLAAAVARSERVASWAVEFGYLRPDWLTFEREGGGAFSHFPCDPDFLRRDLPRPDMKPRHTHPFWREAVGEVSYNLLATLGRPLFPRYVDDKYYWPVLDYLAWAPKLLRGPLARRGAADVERRLIDGQTPFNLLALQMQSDYQLRHCAPFRSQADMIRTVIESFARHAPPDRHLVLKEHPLDNGWANWSKLAYRAAERFGVAGRVSVISGGNLVRLIKASNGVVVANSTVGLHSLQVLKPVITLGAAIYDMPGATHQAGLHRFWKSPEGPRSDVVNAIVSELAATIQFKGSVYMPEGRRIAAEAMARRLHDDRCEHTDPRSGRSARLRKLAKLRCDVATAQP